MQKLRVYYDPTRSNQILVSKLRTIKFLENCEFIDLGPSHVPSKLLLIEGRAAYIWGDGDKHGRSYYFTQKQARAKINLDLHSDLGYVNGGLPTCGNHMGLTELDNLEVYVCFYSRLLVQNGISFGLKFKENEVALTIDCDALLNFPVVQKYFGGQILLSDVMQVVRTLGPRLGRLDIGGLIEDIDDFAILESPLRIPTREETLAFIGRPKRQYLAQETKNLVGSYVVEVYSYVLGAFADMPFVPMPEPEPRVIPRAYDSSRF
jgi:hypothetical protein